MSQFEQDPSASTGRFRAFVERGDDEAPRSGRAPRSRVSPAMIIIAIVAVVVVIAVIVAVGLGSLGH